MWLNFFYHYEWDLQQMQLYLYCDVFCGFSHCNSTLPMTAGFMNSYPKNSQRYSRIFLYGLQNESHSSMLSISSPHSSTLKFWDFFDSSVGHHHWVSSFSQAFLQKDNSNLTWKVDTFWNCSKFCQSQSHTVSLVIKACTVSLMIQSINSLTAKHKGSQKSSPCWICKWLVAKKWVLRISNVAYTLTNAKRQRNVNLLAKVVFQELLKDRTRHVIPIPGNMSVHIYPKS